MNRTTIGLLALALLASPVAVASADDQGRKSGSGTAANAQPAGTSQGMKSAGDTMGSDEIIGADVNDERGEKLGTVSRLLIGRNGQIRSAVVAQGGMMGVGARMVQVPWNDLQLRPKPDDPDAVTVTASRAAIDKAPQFDDDASRSARGASAESDPRAAGANTTSGTGTGTR